MRTLRMVLLALAAALLLTGCFGYGPHMGWGYHGGHMDGYHRGGYPTGPCDPDGRSNPDAPPCPYRP